MLKIKHVSYLHIYVRKEMSNPIYVRKIIIIFMSFFLGGGIFCLAKNKSYENESLVKVSLLLIRYILIKQKTGQL